MLEIQLEADCGRLEQMPQQIPRDREREQRGPSPQNEGGNYGADPSGNSNQRGWIQQAPVDGVVVMERPQARRVWQKSEIQVLPQNFGLGDQALEAIEAAPDDNAFRVGQDGDQVVQQHDQREDQHESEPAAPQRPRDP